MIFNVWISKKILYIYIHSFINHYLFKLAHKLCVNIKIELL